MIAKLTTILASSLLLILVVTGTLDATSLKVVDSKGQVVGDYVFANVGDTAVRQIKGILFGLPMTKQGFSNIEAEVLFLTSDCSGTPFFRSPLIQGFASPLVRYVDGGGAALFNNSLFFGVGAVQSLMVHSCAQVQDPTKPVASSDCFPIPGVGEDECAVSRNAPTALQPFTSFDLATLRFKPPFKVRSN